MPWMDGCPNDQGVLHQNMAAVNAIVLHRTYGAWPGDYSVGKQGIFHFLIGKVAGNWVQFAPSENAQWHANGANAFSVGIELEGTNDEPLTVWQAARLGDVLHWINATHGVPLDYLAPDAVPYASVHVNDGVFHGVLSHCSVQTDDGSQQHTDRIEVADWVRAVSGVIDVALTNDEIAQIAAAVGGQNQTLWGKTTNLGDIYNHIDAVAAQLRADLAKIQTSGGGTVDVDAVATAVADKLAKRLQA